MALNYQNPPTIDAILESIAVIGAGGPPYTVREGVFIGSADGSSNKALVTANSELQVAQTGSTTASVPSQQSVGISASQILASNTSRKECTIINTGITIIYLAFGQNPTTTAYHVALNPCNLANDGTGGSYISDVWLGAINAISSGVGGTVCVTELT